MANQVSIELSEHETVRVTRSAGGVTLEFVAFKLTLARRALTLAQARRLGDALGFASNDSEPAARPCKTDSHQGRPCNCWQASREGQ